jgi:flagellar motility protein MotE (MotC chaperone)
MIHESIGRTGFFVALVLGAATWMPAPLHADGARRTAPPAPVRQARPEQEREKAKRSAEELRAQAERDRIQKERIEQRRKEAQGARPAAPARSIEERREIAKKAAHFEASYRNHVARLNRLIGIYKGKGDDARVARLEQLRQKLDLRREHAMQGFRRDLGDAGFQHVQGQINGAGRRAPEDKPKSEPPKDEPPRGGDR